MSDLQEMKFSEVIAQLEEVVKKLENTGSLELEDALAQYEQGVTLLADLRTRLTRAEQQVTELMGKIEENHKTAV